MKRLMLTAVLLTNISTALQAQGVRAMLVGRVTDETGAIVPAAKITVTNAGTNETRVASPNSDGEYSVPQLLPGEYIIAVESTGFRREVVKGVVLETGQSARLDIVLKVGAVTETVEVTASTPLISSENASVGSVVEQRRIVELPLNGRDYLQLAQ